jgi:predicted phosphodiesterase
LAVFVLLLASPSFAGQDRQIDRKLAGLERIHGAFTFIVLGDNRSGDAEYQKLIAMAVERKPAFIVNTGDQIPSPGDLKDWTAFREMSRIVAVPYFLTVGNHDVNDATTERIYKEQVDLPGNELYYSFIAGNSLFIVLDTYLTGEQKKIAGEQYQWLEAVLRGSKQRHLFVFLHHPLYPDREKGRHFGNCLDRYPEERDRLQALFARHRVAAVFAGHEHLYLRRTVDGVRHVITGGGGAPLYADDKDGGFHHYVLVTVDGDRVSGEVVDITGKVRDRF